MGNLILLFLFSFFCFGDTGSLRKVRGGLIIKATDVNQYRTALKGTVFTRNSSGAVVDQYEGLGSTSFRWDDSYIKKLIFGAYADNIYIENTGTNIEMNVGGAVQMQITSSGLDGNYFKNNSIPQAALNNGTYALSSGSGTFSTTSTSYVAVTNLSATITNQRNLVLVQTISDGSNACYLDYDYVSSTASFHLQIKRDGSVIHQQIMSSNNDIGSTCSFLQFVDNVSGGSSHTYTVEAKVGNAANTLYLYYFRLVAQDI